MIKVVQKDPHRSEVSLIMLGNDARAILSSVSEYGVAATLCPNITEASEALDRRHYHAVLCDLKMRGARQFLQYVRANFPDVAVLVFTHPRDLRLGILATLSGASAYIQTPLKLRTVISVVERALESKRLASALQDRSCRP
jgi:DNA-binding NtrC family response regulator